MRKLKAENISKGNKEIIMDDERRKEIPPFKLVPQPLNEDAKKLPKFKWTGEEIGTRHKLGGKPDYIQAAIYPKCPDCDAEMTFYAQLDSINDEFCIAYCGMIYVFVCFECNTVGSFIESF